MTRRTKVMSAGACAAALAIAGGGAALAATARNGGTANSSKGNAQASSSPRAFAFGWHAFAFHGGPGDKLSAAAGYLGLSGAELLTRLRSGKTLAQIADATAGKSAAGLVDVLVAAEKKELAGAVTAGRLTQSQAEAIGAGLQQRVTAFVHGALPPAGFGGPRDWHGHDDGPGAFGFRRGGFSSGGGIAPPADAPPPGGPTI